MKRVYGIPVLKRWLAAALALAAVSGMLQIGSAPSALAVGPSADGSGSLTVSPASAAAGTTGQTLTLTYAAALGGLSGGSLEIIVPSGFTPPGTSATGAGYTTASTGTVSTSGQTISVTGISTTTSLTVTYGQGGGSTGVTVPTSAGSYAFGTTEASTSTGTLTALASSPSFTVTAGAVDAATSTVTAAQAQVEVGASDTVQVKLVDAHGNPEVGQTVSLAGSSGTTSTIAGSSGSTSVTDSSGVATFTVSDLTPQSVTYTATDATAANTVMTQTTTVDFTTGVGAVSVFARPLTAGASAIWTYGATVRTALVGGADTVTLTAPTGTVFPASPGDYTITDSTPSSGTVTAAPVLASGASQVTITVPIAVSAGDALSIQVAGVTNPSAGTDAATAFTFATSEDPLPESPASGLTFAPATLTSGDLLVFSRAPIAPAGSLGAGAQVSETVTPETSGGIAIPDAEVYLSLATTATSGGGSASVSGTALTGTPQAFSAPGGALTVTYTTGSTTAGTDSLTAASAATGAQVSASATYDYAPTAVSQVSVSTPDNLAGQSAPWAYALKVTTALGAGTDTITLTAPAGTVFPAGVGAYAITDQTTASGSGTVTATPVLASGGAKVTITVPNAIRAGDVLSVAVTGVTNPGGGNYGASAFTAATSQDLAPVAAASGHVFLSVLSAGDRLVFSRAPVAPAGSLGAGAQVTEAVTAETSVGVAIPYAEFYLSFATTAGSGGGIASVAFTRVTGTPQAFITLTGTATVTYTAGSATSGTDSLTAASAATGAQVSASATYEYASTAVSQVSVAASGNLGGQSATWTYALKVTSGLGAGTDTITLTAPAGTVFPAGAGAYAITDQTTASGSGTVTATPVLANGGATATIGVPNAIQAGDALSVAVTGVTNPGGGSYGASAFTAATSQDRTPVAASSGLAFFTALATGDKLVFSRVPVAPAGSLGAGAQVTETVTAETSGGAPIPDAEIYLSLATTPTSGGGSASASGTTLSGTPLALPAPSGTVTVTYSAGSATVGTDSLTAASAATGAQVSASATYGYAKTAVSQVSVAASDNLAGQTAVWTYRLTVTSGLGAGTDTVTLTAPSGTVFPASANAYQITDSTTASGSGTVTATPVLANGGATATIAVPNAIRAGDALSVAVTGVTNPGSGSYGASAFTAATSQDLTPMAASAGHLFFSALSAGDRLVFSPTTLGVSGSLAAGAKVSETVTAETSGGTAIPYVEVDLSFATTATSGGGSAAVAFTRVTGTPQAFATPTGAVTVTYTAGSATSGTDNLTAASAASGAQVSATATYGYAKTTVSLVGVSDSSLAAEQPATWTYDFTVASALGAGTDTITLTAPGGTLFPASANDYAIVDPTHPSGSGTVAATPVLANGGAAATIVVPAAIQARDVLTVTVADVANPAQGAFPANDFTVVTSADLAPAASASGLTFVSAVKSLALSPSGIGGGVPATWTYTFTAAPGASLAAGTGTLSLLAPTGTTFPPGAADYSLDDTTSDASAAVSQTPTIGLGGASAQVVVPIAVSGGDHVTLTVRGVTNPAAGTYSASAFTLATSTDTVAASPASALTFASLPGAPSHVVATAGNASAAVSWLAPASAGSSPVIGYVVTVLPSGATVSVGAASTTADITGLTNGTPYTFSVAAKNAAGTGTASLPSAAVTPALPPPPPVGGSPIAAPLAIPSTVLPSATAGVPYRENLRASGGTLPYTWSAASLPVGWSLSPQGVLSGTPQAVGSVGIAVRVRDPSGGLASASFELTVLPPPLSIAPPRLPVAQVGTYYEARFAAQGGAGPFTWRFVGGEVPPGMVLTRGGDLSGVPTAAGSFRIVVTVSDMAGQAASTAISLVVRPAPLRVTTTRLPAGQAGTLYIATLSAAGGVHPYTWRVSAGRLPKGLRLASDGRLTGTPREAGTVKVVASVSDGSVPALDAHATFTLVIAQAPAVEVTVPKTARAKDGTSGSVSVSIRNVTASVVILRAQVVDLRSAKGEAFGALEMRVAPAMLRLGPKASHGPAVTFLVGRRTDATSYTATLLLTGRTANGAALALRVPIRFNIEPRA